MIKKSNLIDNLEAVSGVFNTVDMPRADFGKSGRNMKEVEQQLGIRLFDCDENHMKCIYSLQKETVKENLNRGEKAVNIPKNDYFKEGKAVLIYNLYHKKYEFNQVKEIKGNTLILSKGLQNAYPEGSVIIAIRQIEYKRSTFNQVLKRRIDNGRFLPVLHNVTVLSITRFPNSLNVYYGIEVNNGVQINGYFYLMGLV